MSETKQTTKLNNQASMATTLDPTKKIIWVLMAIIVGGAFFSGYVYGQFSILKSGVSGGSLASGSNSFSTYAKDIGLNQRAFNSCMEADTYAQAIEDDLALASQVGATGTPSFFLNGRLIVGAQPYAVFQQALDAAIAGDEQALDEAILGSYAEDQPLEPLSQEAWQALLSDPAAQKGDLNSEVVFVEFTDYQCPFCARHASQTDSQIQANYVETGQIRYIIRDLPLPFHDNAKSAAAAARCAGEQDKYWEMHDKLFQEQSTWSEWTL